VLWLRAVLLSAQSVLAVYAWSVGLGAMVAWNTLFVCINAAWVARLLHERRAVAIPEVLRALHAGPFAAMSAQEFLRFWRLGVEVGGQNAALTTEGDYPSALWLVVRGHAEVSRGGRRVAALHDGQFAGEMSLITGRPANATVALEGEALLHSWPVAGLRELQESDQALWSRVQAVLGADLVAKVGRGERVEP